MKVLITGGAGYLGSVLTRELLESRHYVRVLDNLTFGDASLRELEVNSRFQLVQGDVSHLTDVTSAMTDIDAVVALAAIVVDSACKNNRSASIQTNYWGTKLLAEVAASQGATRFLFASTCSVYGVSHNVLLTEESEVRPLSLYAETKAESERALMEISGSLKPIALRLSTLCGPSYRMRFDLVLNIMTATAHFEKEVQVFGGSQVRPLLDVRDASGAFRHLLEAPKESFEHQLYNVGSNVNNLTIEQLGKMVAATVGDVELVTKPELTDVRSYRVDFSRVTNSGFHSRIPLETSVLDIVNLLQSKGITNYKADQFYNSRCSY